MKFPCAARIPRSIVASQEYVALIVDQRNRLILLYNKNVAAKVPDQISGNAANEYVGDVRKTALTADNQLGLERLDHQVMDGFLNATNLNDNLYGRDVWIFLG